VKLLAFCAKCGVGKGNINCQKNNSFQLAVLNIALGGVILLFKGFVVLNLAKVISFGDLISPNLFLNNPINLI
jgi:hypothetical protein